MVERGLSPDSAALAPASRRARRTRSGPRLGCGSCGRTGACAIRSRCWTPLAPAACGQVWRRLPSRPATSGGLLNASPAGAGLIGRAQEGPPCLHSIRAAEPRVGWLQRWRLSANRPRRGSLSFVVLKQAVREETQRRRGRGRVALAPFSLSDNRAYGKGEVEPESTPALLRSPPGCCLLKTPDQRSSVTAGTMAAEHEFQDPTPAS
jgi:hypothetical protein